MLVDTRSEFGFAGTVSASPLKQTLRTSPDRDVEYPLVEEYSCQEDRYRDVWNVGSC